MTTADVSVYNDDGVGVDENAAAAADDDDDEDDDDDDDRDSADVDTTTAAEAGMTSWTARTALSDVIKQTTRMTTRRLETIELR